MFARKDTFRLKGHAADSFIQKMDGEIIPLLRRQKGFLNEVTLLSQAGKEIYTYSFWENSDDAEMYERIAFAEVTNLLSELIEGAVRINTYRVATSTFHEIAAAVAS
jgi:hypothetical protein